MQKIIKWFVAAFGAMFGITAGFLATAGVGDLIYMTNPVKVELTGEQAVCFANCAINAGMWTGAAADMVMTCARRDTQSSTGFSGEVVGLKTSPPGSLPTSSEDPVQVVGIVQ